MTRSSDLVMVEREPTEAMLNAAHDWSMAKYGIGIGNDAAAECWQAMIAAALQSVEGGVQVAAKQESCPEGAPRTETDVRCAVNYLLEQIAAKFEAWDTMDLWRSDAASLVRSFKHDLTKTPSADHDAGNLRGLAEPNNHQPHALSQGWQPIETAPEDGDILIFVPRPQVNSIWIGQRDFETGNWFDAAGDAICALDEPTHWMPLPAPPLPENTPRDSSESTTGGVS